MKSYQLKAVQLRLICFVTLKSSSLLNIHDQCHYVPYSQHWSRLQTSKRAKHFIYRHRDGKTKQLLCYHNFNQILNTFIRFEVYGPITFLNKRRTSRNVTVLEVSTLAPRCWNRICVTHIFSVHLFGCSNVPKSIKLLEKRYGSRCFDTRTQVL